MTTDHFGEAPPKHSHHSEGIPHKNFSNCPLGEQFVFYNQTVKGKKEVRTCRTSSKRRESAIMATNACPIENPATLSAMAEYLGITERCVRDRLKELNGEYVCKAGIVFKTRKTEN